jgi:hypothetical protein
MKGKLNNISQGKKIDADYKVKLPPKLAKK